MLLVLTFLGFVFGSHFRSGSFQFSQDKDHSDKIILTRTLNYRRGFSGYDPACTKQREFTAEKNYQG